MLRRCRDQSRHYQSEDHGERRAGGGCGEIQPEGEGQRVGQRGRASRGARALGVADDQLVHAKVGHPLADARGAEQQHQHAESARTELAGQQRRVEKLGDHQPSHQAVLVRGIANEAARQRREERLHLCSITP